MTMDAMARRNMRDQGATESLITLDYPALVCYRFGISSADARPLLGPRGDALTGADGFVAVIDVFPDGSDP